MTGWNVYDRDEARGGQAVRLRLVYQRAILLLCGITRLFGGIVRLHPEQPILASVLSFLVIEFTFHLGRQHGTPSPVQRPECLNLRRI